MRSIFVFLASILVVSAAFVEEDPRGLLYRLQHANLMSTEGPRTSTPKAQEEASQLLIIGLMLVGVFGLLSVVISIIIFAIRWNAFKRSYSFARFP
ncbi:hypothetical protein M3Y95_00361400 [Aphelenchoides besseyi]|nr:hypothetical protein M3Y95_00361400 [Aphelenchoides besseyi]